MAVDVGSAQGYLDIDISGFVSGLRTAQSEATTQSKNIAESMSQGLQSAGESMTKVGGMFTAGVTTPIVTGVATAVKQFANLEQSIGGIETLFKNSASTVIASAETAYARAGLDANAYMEQVTSFSATLLQGLGGDTATAAKVADKAIVDMSDNANKMGTSMESIQNAYQGFAKDNYTMLDNLKLGYGGTASEMARLVNDSGVMGDSFEATAENVKDIPFDQLIEAIHKTQEGLGITGTTAKEATETVSGSFQQAKSSVLNFFQQLGNPGADMDKFAQAMIDSIGIFVDNVKRVLLTIWDNLPLTDLQKKLLVAAAAFGPVLLVAGKVTSVIGTIVGIVGKVGPAITGLATKFGLIGTAAEGAGAAAGTGMAAVAAPILAVVAVVAVLVGAFVTLWKNNEEFRNKMIAIWQEIKDKVQGFIDQIKQRTSGLKQAFENIVNFIKPIWEGFCNFLAPIFVGVWQFVSDTFGAVLDIIIGILDIFIGIFTGDWDSVWNGVKEIFSAVWNWIVDLLTNVGNILMGLLDAICDYYSAAWEATWNKIKDFFSNTWNNIVTFFTNIVTSITTAVSNFVTTIITFFQQLPTNIVNFITSAWNSIVTWASNMVNKAVEMGQNFLNAVVTFFADLPYKIGYFIGNALASIVLWVTNMVEKAKEVGTNFLNQVVAFFAQLPGKVLQFITSAFNNVQTWATNMASKAKEMATNFLNNIVSFFAQLPGKVLQFITSALNKVQTWATNMANKAREMGTNFISNVVSFFTQLPGKIKQYLDSAINNLKTWVTQMGTKGKEAVKSLINNVITAAKGIPEKVMSIGSNIVSGVWKGICNAKDAFVNNVKGFFSGIVDGVKDALGIRSPSTVFEKQIGKWMPGGVAVGFKKAMPAAIRDIQTALSDGINSVEADDIEIGADANVTSFADKIKSIYENVAVWFESIDARLAKSVDDMIQSLNMLINAGQIIANSDGTLGYVGYNGFTPPGTPRPADSTSGGSDSSGDGDTYNFYSPKAIDEIEAAKQLKKAKRDIAEGF